MCKKIGYTLLIALFLWSCTDDETRNINSGGQVKLDHLGITDDGWGVGPLVVSHDGLKIYYAAVNYQTSRHEMRVIDEAGKVKKLFSGDGQIDALDISADDGTLLYSRSAGHGVSRTSKMYEFNLTSQIPSLIQTITGDGYFWDVTYLSDGDIVYTQGDGAVGNSLRRIDPVSKDVTVLLEKSENPLLIDVDNEIGKLLVLGWSNSRIIVLNADGSDVEDYGEQKTGTRPVAFSPDGSEFLALEFDTDAPENTEGYYTQAVAFNLETGQKTTLTHALEENKPVGYGADTNTLILNVTIGNQLPGELMRFERETSTYTRLTNNNASEIFLALYNHSSDRVIYSAIDGSGTNLYIVNK